MKDRDRDSLEISWNIKPSQIAHTTEFRFSTTCSKWVCAVGKMAFTRASHSSKRWRWMSGRVKHHNSLIHIKVLQAQWGVCFSMNGNRLLTLASRFPLHCIGVSNENVLCTLSKNWHGIFRFGVRVWNSMKKYVIYASMHTKFWSWSPKREENNREI
jgi:hypothetical protein